MKSINHIRSIVLALLALQIVPSVKAGQTDIANSPLFTSSESVVKSNVMFILDDSGSMGWDFLPDDAAQSGSGKYGYYASQCNGVAFNPNTIYAVPVKADGTYYASSTFATAKSDGIAGTGSTDLAGKYYYTYSGSQPAMTYTYTSAGLVTSSTFYKECNSSEGNTPGSGVFTKVTMASGSVNAQNYANWYTYYRTRMLMMKSSVGLAFAPIDTKYRIGFKTISNASASGTNFLDIKDFDLTQKPLFYSKLYGASPSGSTPLRGALSTAGQYYANKASGQTYDPVQYSCQKNFTILSTDGYWNTPLETSSYGPLKLNNSTKVGQQDGGGTARPMYDGSALKSSTTRTWTTTSVSSSAVTTPKTSVTTSSSPVTTGTPVKTWTRTSYTLGPLTAPLVTRTNRELRCSSPSGSGCTIRVRTDQDHGFSTGNMVTIAGVSPAAYNGTFSIVKTNSDEYTFFLPSQPSDASTTGTSSTGGGGGPCPSGQGTRAAQSQVQSELQGSTTTTVTTTTSNNSSTTTTTTTGITPKTRITIVVDGVTTSDITTSGTTSNSNSSATTTTTGTAVVTTTSSTGASNVQSYTAWSNSGAATTSCAASIPSPNPSTATSSAPASTASVTVNGTTVVTGPTTTNGTASTVTSAPVVTDGPVTTTTTPTSSGGSADSLADVAMYYYNTDLRTSALSNCTGSLGVDVCANDVAGGSLDTATWQHMTTFTLGLGNSGELKFDPKYLTQNAGDYFDIKQGTKNWPIPDGNAANIDDLWHAAVDGHGQYFSASDPSSLASGLKDALDSIKTITGSAAGAASSSLQPVQGNNDIYVAQFTTNKWTGDIHSYKIDPLSGAIATTATWSAQAQVDAVAASTRKIYYAKAAGVMSNFTDANLTTDGLQGNFSNFCGKTGAGATAAPTQCAGMNAANKTIANLSASMVDYLRGASTYFVYRVRDHVLGDVINASPLFVGKPSFKYTENGYKTFASTAPVSTRAGVVYAAANDGMLHAFDQTTGNEKWAYVPVSVMPNMYKLGDANYPGNHQSLLDGSPVMGDIFVGGAWKTIIVGGLNAGGRSYYALDITDPTAPKKLWEFSDSNLGLSFGNPIITKKKDGTWVVLFASGYNNVSTGDGNGHLFMVDANTGAKLLDLATASVGTTTTPSGLAKINAYVASDIDNTADVVYGGDLLGNVWRFDINSTVPPYLSAMLLAELKIGSAPQPITTKPAVAEVSYQGSKFKVVYVGTGKYLGATDLTDTSKQTIYALKDTRAATGLGKVRTAKAADASDLMVVQTASTASSATQGSILTVTTNPVNWTSKGGWYLDLIGSGERISINPHLVLNTLFVGTNTPKNDACTVGGTSMLYKLDIGTGSALSNSTDHAAAVSLGNVLVMGMTTVQLGGGTGTGNVSTIVSRSDGTLSTVTGAQAGGHGALRRTSWRVLK